jgi:putative heme degradation protein
MATQQLVQMSAVRTDRFNITGFATFTVQETVIKQILQTAESNPSDIYVFVGQYTL